MQSGFSGQLPPCKPAGFTLEKAKSLLGLDFRDVSQLLGTVIKSIRGPLPNTWTFTDADLRKILGAEDQIRLDDALKTMRKE